MTPGSNTAPPSAQPQTSVHLNPVTVEEQKRRRARQLHVGAVPVTRLAGFAALLLLVFLHNRFILHAFSWGAWLGLAGILLGWALLGWLLLWRFYDRFGTRLAFALLFADIAMFALVVYASGGEKSWLFFVLAVRSTDVAFVRARQLMFFAHASALAYALLLAWLYVGEGRAFDWPAEGVKVLALWVICLYLAATGRIVEALRGQTAAAVRAARDLARRLEEAWRRADMLSVAKSRFLASMSHDLRAPLHAIIGSTRLVQDTGLTAAQQRYFTAIGLSTQNLLYTVNQILDFFRVEAGKVEVERQPFALRATVQSVVQSLGIRAEERELELACHIGEDVPDAVVGDPGRLRQVLVNLVDNGLKFTERGGVTVEVRVAGRSSGEASLRFSVADTGIGIRPEDRNLIFEAFAQAPVPGAVRRDGSGLGLAIASELVRRLGGELEVQSEPGHGSTFHFTIALALSEREEFPGSSAAGEPIGEEAAAQEGGRGLHILIVEDDALAAEVAREALVGRGHTVVVAKDGRTAIETFGVSDFDVALMDVQLPDMDGPTVAARFRERERPGHRRCRVVALTASAAAGDRERCLAAGIDAYLTKPADPRAFIAAIEALPDGGGLAGLEPRGPAATRVTRLFLSEAPRLVADLRSCLNRRDRAEVVKTSHRLKGTIAIFGASAALAAAERLEALAQSDHLAAGGGSWTALENQLQSLSVALTSLIETIGLAESPTSPAAPPSPAAAPPGSPAAAPPPPR